MGIGTWAIGGGDWVWGWGSQDADEAIAGICRGVDLGVNWIDTAAVYGDGASEELVGRALKKLSKVDRPIVATKCGRIMRDDGTIFGRLSRESVMTECEASLRRLGVEAIDLYQMHWPDPDADIEEGWAAMWELKKQGKVRHIGVSNASVAQMERLQAIHPVASLQPPYHMMARGVEDELLPFCGGNGIGVVCYSPMAKGLLTGAFSAERVAGLENSDHRRKDPMFQSPRLERNLRVVEVLRLVAERHKRPMAQVAVAWVLRREEVTSAIVGVRKPSHIEETAGAAGWELQADDLAVIHTALVEREAEE